MSSVEIFIPTLDESASIKAMKVNVADLSMLEIRLLRINKNGYAYELKLGNKKRLVARKLLKLQKDDLTVVDHINRDKLDNRRENLRVASRAENNTNVGRRPGTARKQSKYRGVYWEKSCSRWRVQVEKAGKKQHIGVFKTELEAARAYDKAAKELHGEFAPVNFPTPQVLFNACVAEANRIQQAVKEQYPNSEGIYNFGGDGAPPTTNESTAVMMQALIDNFPQYAATLRSEMPQTAQAEYNTAAQVSPQYAALLNNLYSTYGPGLAEAGAGVERINRVGAANTDLAILQGPGGQLVTEAQNLDRSLNPEFYNVRQQTARSIGDLLSSVNPNDPNPEAERLVGQEMARTGNLGAPTSATNTVSNALQFGNERMKRVNALGNAIGAATGFLQQGRSEFNPVTTALNRPSTNAGANQFGGIQQGAGQNAYSMGQGLMGQIGQLRQQEVETNANRRDSLDRFNETMGSMPSISL